MSFIDDLEKNQILYDYFRTVKNGIACTLLQSKIVLTGTIKLVGASATTKILSLAGHIPSIGSILKAGGKSLAPYNEAQTLSKL